MKPFLLLSSLFLTLASMAKPVTEKVNVLDLVRNGAVEFNLNPDADLADLPEKVFQINKDMLHISGRGYGYMATKDEFNDYHLVVEFKWGTKTWGKRAECARDNGILVHAHGPHGAAGGTWIASFEAQIIDGGMGDIIVISAKLKDGTKLTSSLTSEIELDRDGEKRWKRGAPRKTVTGGRINWEKRDPDWKDIIDYRGADDLDAPAGEWNRLEVIAKGDTLRYIFNGQTVIEAFDVSPCTGRICIQTEAAEMIVRRFELWPLGQFKEKWSK
ncbi:MAG: DUF1080 domain-containing protein [Kiritimatiellae bacterium]|jgi:hypothetical protein|nr:DUF1080 domain-containing protein [Kiritimatiellia bacterium]